MRVPQRPLSFPQAAAAAQAELADSDLAEDQHQAEASNDADLPLMHPVDAQGTYLAPELLFTGSMAGLCCAYHPCIACRCMIPPFSGGWQYSLAWRGLRNVCQLEQTWSMPSALPDGRVAISVSTLAAWCCRCANTASLLRRCAHDGALETEACVCVPIPSRDP